MSAISWLQTIEPSLRRKGIEDVEMYLKQGRSRLFEVGPQGVIVSQSSEHGWAVRGSGLRTSVFIAGTDEPPANGPWPAPDGYPVPLPPAFSVDEWVEPADLDAPLLVEAEALDLLEACARELERELSGARLLRAVLEDGASESQIANSLGVETSTRARSATLFLEAAAADGASTRITELVAEREGRRFNPISVSRRLADRLIIRTRGRQVDRDRAPCLLAPAVAAKILGGILPLLIGPEAAIRARARVDRQARLGSEALTIVDDPRLPGGLASASSDGEGVPTRSLLLVEEGTFRRSLVGWWQVEPRPVQPAGCSRRPSWREPPRIGPSHLFIRPDRTVAVSSLLAAVTRGFYFLEALPGVHFDLAADRFSLPVAGFQIEGGRSSRPVSRAVLRGRISALLHGVHGVARDLTFFPVGGFLGSPSVLVHGLEIASD